MIKFCNWSILNASGRWASTLWSGVLLQYYEMNDVCLPCWKLGAESPDQHFSPSSVCHNIHALLENWSLLTKFSVFYVSFMCVPSSRANWLVCLLRFGVREISLLDFTLSIDNSRSRAQTCHSIQPAKEEKPRNYRSSASTRSSCSQPTRYLLPFSVDRNKN